MVKSSLVVMAFLAVVYATVASGDVKKNVAGDWRGFNIHAELPLSRLKDVAATGATVVRVSFHKMPFISDKPPYKFSEEAFSRLDEMIAVAKQQHLRIILDPHHFPGTARLTTTLPSDELWRKKLLQDRTVALWAAIAERYRDESTIVAYDLLNEPSQPKKVAGTDLSYNTLLERIVSAIRGTGDKHWLLVEAATSGGHGGRRAGLATLRLPADSRLVLSVHIYQPSSFTFQGLRGRPKGVHYPGIIDGVMWDKNRLAESLESISAFSKEHSIPVVVTEFSVDAFAGRDGGQYLSDLISLFEDRRWGWMYLNFGAARDFDIETPESDLFEAGTNAGIGARMNVLKFYFKKTAE